MWSEHTNTAGRGSEPSTVTVGAAAGEIVITVSRALQRELPWFRGGGYVAVMLGRGPDAGRMRIVRGHTHKLLEQRASGSVEKMPPVLLRMDALPTMRPGAEHAPETVAHAISQGTLEVSLPPWACPPVPAVAPPTTLVRREFAPMDALLAEGAR